MRVQAQSLPSAFQNFYKTIGDIDLLELNDELERFVVIIRKNQGHFKTGNDFLTYSHRRQLLKMHSNLCGALRVLLTCPDSVAGAERSFSKLKLIKTFHRPPMMDESPSSLAMISIERACVRDSHLNHVVDEFAAEKVRKTF